MSDTHVTIFIGDFHGRLSQVKHKALHDDWHPVKQIASLQSALKRGLRVFATNSPVALGYLSCLVKNNMHFATNERYPVNVTSTEVREFDIVGNVKTVPDYKGLPSDHNVVNNTVGLMNEWFSELQQLNQKLSKASSYKPTDDGK
jgi:hypothetical protein